jgi:hypothetical protein
MDAKRRISRSGPLPSLLVAGFLAFGISGSSVHLAALAAIWDRDVGTSMTRQLCAGAAPVCQESRRNSYVDED